MKRPKLRSEPTSRHAQNKARFQKPKQRPILPPAASGGPVKTGAGGVTEATMDAPGIRPPNGAVTGGTDFMHDAVPDLCTIISANYTRHKSTMKATRKGMPVSFAC